MNEPERLFATDPDLVALHEVLDRDEPPSGAIERAAARLLAESTSVGAPRETGAGRISRSKPWIIGGIGVMSVVALLLVGTSLRPAPERKLKPGTSTEVVSAPVDVPVPSAMETPPAEPSIHVDDLPPASRPTASPTSARSADPLVEELELVERARAALARGRGRECLEATRRYETRFAKGGLFREEVEVMHIEALALSGERGAAHTRGERFLAAHPDTPYIERVRRVLDQASAQKSPSAP